MKRIFYYELCLTFIILIYLLDYQFLYCQTQYSGATFSLPSDNPGVTTNIISINDVGTILDIDVIVNFSGSNSNHLRNVSFYIISPSNSRVLLAHGIDVSFGSLAGIDMTNTRFNDEAASSITNGTSPYVGNYRPIGSLSMLDNESMNGNWELAVYNNTNWTATCSYSLVITSDISTPSEPVDYGTEFQSSAFIIPSNNPGTTVNSIIIGNNETINEVNVRVTFDATSPGAVNLVRNITLTLESPSGNTVLLGKGIDVTNGFLHGSALYKMIFDDDLGVPQSVSSVPAYSEIYKPIEFLSAFNGENCNGTWNLYVYNQENYSAIASWSLYLNPEQVPVEEEPCPGLPTVIYEGKVYNTVLIGSQCWLKENLDVGTMILGNQDATNDGTIQKYCYDNNPINCSVYGGLYQWNEAMQYDNDEGSRGICPPGWHIPTNSEYESLSMAVNNDGNALKAVGQGTGSGAGTNESCFSALLAGRRYYDSNFDLLGYDAYFWSSTEDASHAYSVDLHYNSSGVYFFIGLKSQGFSVRCIYDFIVPVELENFRIEINGNGINLKWTTATETNNRGFEIERSNDSQDFYKIGFVNGAGTTTEKNTYLFCDENPNNGISYYRLKQIDYDGSFEYSKTIEVNFEKQLDFSLSQNYPNPFNPSTKIKYSIPEKCFISLKIFDVLGNEIQTLANEKKEAGNYEIEFDGSEFPSGVYFIKLNANQNNMFKKMLLLK
ncbi:MAG: FISUMP domain-containing protein [bacterium]